MSRRLLRSARAPRVATLGHGGDPRTTVIPLAGSGRWPLATGGGSSAPWPLAPLLSEAPGWRAPRERGLPSAGPV